jgi:hypothetical protein
VKPAEEGGAVQELDDKVPEGEDAKPDLDLSILDGLKVNKLGKIVKEDVSSNPFQFQDSS